MTRLGSLGLALRLLRRDWRGGDARVLAAALVVAAAAASSVAFVGDRALALLEGQGNELLAADRVVASSEPIPLAWQQRAASAGIATTRTLAFPTMVQSEQGVRLAALKAVADGYPLYGRLRSLDGRERPPQSGELWVDARLAAALAVAPGDRLQVGDATLTLAAVLAAEPDRSSRLFSLAPRLLMNLADVPATGLLQPYSRVRHRLLLAGSPSQLARYEAWIKPRLGATASIISVDDARPAVRTALQRASRFLGLAGMVAVMLAAVAVGIAARAHSQRNLDLGAMLRCLGATRARVVALVLTQTLVVGLAAGLAGTLMGYGLQQLLAGLLQSLADAPVPPASWRPWLVGVGVALGTLAAFALPSLLALGRVPVMRVLRRDVDVGVGSPLWLWLPGMAWVLLLLLWQAGDLRLGAWVAGGVAATVLALAGVSWLLVLALRPLRRGSGGGWRLGLANLARRPAAAIIQAVGYGLGIMALLLLTVVRGDLFEAWRQQLPADAPNRFVIDIRADQIEPLQQFFAARELEPPQFFPMVRGRLLALNDDAVKPGDYPPGRARRLVAREFNLSHSAQPPAHNTLVAGDWWRPGQGGLLSVESGIAETLGLIIGDRLRFEVLGQVVEGRVANLRRVAWDSFRVNFFVITSPDLLASIPSGYITSFFLPDGDEALLDTLVQRFPNLTVIDVAAVMAQVRGIMDRVAAVLAWVFLFTLAAGVVLMAAAINLTRHERAAELAVLRTLGARRVQLRSALLAEYAALGAIAGLVGAAGAGLGGWVVATRVLSLDYQPGWGLWAVSPLAASLLVAAVGWLSLRGLLKRPPRELLAG